jgi:hypothetical protein
MGVAQTTHPSTSERNCGTVAFPPKSLLLRCKRPSGIGVMRVRQTRREPVTVNWPRCARQLGLWVNRQNRELARCCCQMRYLWFARQSPQLCIPGSLEQVRGLLQAGAAAVHAMHETATFMQPQHLSFRKIMQQGRSLDGSLINHRPVAKIGACRKAGRSQSLHGKREARDRPALSANARDGWKRSDGSSANPCRTLNFCGEQCTKVLIELLARSGISAQPKPEAPRGQRFAPA